MSNHAKNGFGTEANGYPLELRNCLYVSGSIHWVDSQTGDNGNSGSEAEPLATLAQAITNATANNGDIILIKSGHTETLTSAITISKAGLRVFGIGEGSAAPKFTVNAAVDGITVTADDVTLTNLYFPVGTTATNTARINVAADRVRIKSCTFLCGAYDSNSITIAAAGTNCHIDSCSFTVSADGPDTALVIEGTSTGLHVEDCSFDGGSAANNFDSAAIYSTQAHLNYILEDCTFTNSAGVTFSGNAKGVIINPIEGDGSQVSV